MGELPDDPYKYAVQAYPPGETDGECHRCGYDFDADEWEVRHLHGGASAGETWKYTCPECEKETVQVGT